MSSRSRAWFGNVALCEVPRRRHEALWFLFAAAGCSAPDARELFVALPSNSVSEGASGSGGNGGSGSGAGGSVSIGPDASAAGASGREGQGGTLALSDAGGGEAGSGSSGPALLDAGTGDAAAAAPDSGEESPACIARQEVCDGLDNDCDGVSDQGATCVAQCDGFVIDGRGYMFCSAAVNRGEAIGRCELEGMHLVWMDSEEEQAAVIENINAADVPLPAGDQELLTQIGASDAGSEGVWRWVGTDLIADSYPFWQGGTAAQGGAAVGNAFASWDDSEPNDLNDEDCALMSVTGGASRSAGAWDDRGCEAAFPFTCEQE